MKKDRMKSAETNVLIGFVGSPDESLFHFQGCRPAESKYEDLGRIDIAVFDQIADALCQDQRFAASRPCDDLAGPKAAADRLPLGGIKI